MVAWADSQPATAWQAVTFAGNATDPNGDAVTVLWDFGDGIKAEGPLVTHFFAATGTKPPWPALTTATA